MSTTADSNQIISDVQDYYGKVLKSSDDLKTPVCCTRPLNMSKNIKDALSQIHEEVQNRYYGCGLCIPTCLEGAKVLDLGSGAGRDCYLLSKLVGENGHVTGLDMTEEQLEVARKYKDYHSKLFGHKASNVDFLFGYIEKLTEAGIKENFFDLIVSNCVVNLSPDKKTVLEEAFRALKEGGELYFSDVYASRPVPEDLRQNKVLWGECLSGALTWKDLVNFSKEVGFSAPRLVSVAPIDITNPEIVKLVGDMKFISVTCRVFKLPAKKEEAGEVIYEGTVTDHPDSLNIDISSTFKASCPTSVDSTMATILKSSRYADDFTFNTSGPSEAKKSCQPKKLDCTMDPFVYLETKPVASGCGPKTSGKCC
ncbi:arsenite methyltransferase-like [Antedon mediterranea]|uniref:arsenite methyltransferase-like n=1 Tax=Antedon mediterranea TaxID=105859 RepID=UPI003AF91E50